MPKRLLLSESDKDVLARLAAGLSPAQVGGQDVLAAWRLIVSVRRHWDRYGRGWELRATVDVVDGWYAAMRSLTLRELEVACWAAAGLSNREIGRELMISTLTVQRHMLSILAKVSLSNRTELAVCALRWGWVDGVWCEAQIDSRRRRSVM